MKKISIIVMMVLIFTLLVAVAPASATTGPCETATPGYWKNHPEAWPVDGLFFEEKGDPDPVLVWYTKAEIIELLKMPVKGDKSITMFKALVAARLSIKSCPDVDDCKTCILENGIYPANFWMKMHPVGSGVEAKSDAWQEGGEQLYWLLDDFNNGLLCAPHRD